MKYYVNLISLALLFGVLTPAFSGDFRVSSPTFNPDTPLPLVHVFNGFGCEGGNQSPELHWTSAPAGARSFAVTLYDPDAPTGSGWWHWVVYNIPASVQGLPLNAGTPDGKHLPEGAVQGVTDFGQRGFGGACPPAGAGKHRYILTVYALKVDKLPVSPDASPAMIGFMINQNLIDSAVLQSTYGR